jgi:pimeloyl-ACP methyl ester carboxylesterase
VLFVDVAHTPLSPDASPVRIAFREFHSRADGTPIVFLHGGWGYDAYPFDLQIEAFGADHRIVIPDRTGYGGSPALDSLPSDFHARAAEETRLVIDALDLRRPVLWGHSDGAIIALRLGLADPGRFAGIVAEATHFFRRKPRSQGFFEAVVTSAESTAIMKLHARAWLEIGARTASPTDDFYDGRLSELDVPALILHGARDPRTEPGEIDALSVAALAGPPARLEILEKGGHSPHSEQTTTEPVNRIVGAFLATLEGSPHIRS